MSCLVTDTGFFGYLSSDSSYSQKVPKNAAKMDRSKVVFEDMHSRVNLIFQENTCEISDTHGLFPLFVFEFEVKIYYMQNAVFHFHR